MVEAGAAGRMKEDAAEADTDLHFSSSRATEWMQGGRCLGWRISGSSGGVVKRVVYGQGRGEGGVEEGGGRRVRLSDRADPNERRTVRGGRFGKRLSGGWPGERWTPASRGWLEKVR